MFGSCILLIYNKEKKAIKADTGIAELSRNAEGSAEKILHEKRYSEGAPIVKRNFTDSTHV